MGRLEADSVSSNGTSAPPETSSASCDAASSTKPANVSCSARLCMPAGSPQAHEVLLRAAYVAGRTERSGGHVDAWRGHRLGRLVAGAGGAQPVGAVAAHRVDDRDQRPALLGELVLDARRDLREGLARDDALLLERAQPQRQRARGDAVQRALELTEPAATLGEVADHQQRPLAADDLCGAD